ncbi:MAG: helix-turn-helix transcriptional regulator [Phycisphaerales bacterium JB039]
MSRQQNVARGPAGPGPETPGWTFLTNHSHVLVCLHRDPHIRLREVAEMVGITERAVQRIVLDLELGGVISRHREGRRNVYQVHVDSHLRHPIEAHRTVGDLLQLAAGAPPAPGAVTAQAGASTGRSRSTTTGK